MAVAGADSAGNALNNLGQVVGWMTVGADAHAFVSTGTAPTDLGTLGGGSSYATAINDHGQIVGNSYVSGGDAYRGFIVDGGGMSALPGPDYLKANAINNAGTVAGEMTVSTPDGDRAHAYTYSAGTFTDLGTLSASYGSRATAINNAGDVVGAGEVDGPIYYPTDPFLYSKGKMIDLGNLDPDRIYSGANAINDRGQIVGYAGLNYNLSYDGDYFAYTAFLYENGVMKNLGGLAPQAVSSALGINKLGQVVGFAYMGNGFAHGFLYEDGQMIDLNTLIDPATGWTIARAVAINDLGQIAATACRNGVCQAVRLDGISPVPEPSAHALLLAGLVGLALNGRRALRFRSPALRRRG
jgi:probable HAF family extracellular repeat protein